ncbi:MAG: ornithine carbamoyltransferase [Desulfovibrio sp.]|nr:ornithine carbamoyltransferase [Desulfovibrio sp.]
MARHILTIREFGEDASWLIVQQALGMPDAKMQTDFMTERVALLIFAQPSLPERLCVSAAVRQMGGNVIYEGSLDIWRSELYTFQDQLIPIFSTFINCMYTYGLPVTEIDSRRAEALQFPIINAGSPGAHPAHALADIACMLRYSRYLPSVTCACVGCINGTLLSLIEATAWFPFALRVALPPSIDATPVQEAKTRLGSKITLVDTPEEAVAGANYVMAGPRGNLSEEELQHWQLTPALMAKAENHARVMLSASPVRAIHVDKDIMVGKTSLLHKQAENRLRVHKRMLHWVFLDNE